MNSHERPSPLFPRLRPGRSARSAEWIAEHQRGRLMGAMIESVSRHGYAETTVTELVALAGVSKRDFYEIFASGEECFLATFEEIIDRVAVEIRASGASGNLCRVDDGA